jgi:hypothetical protein
MTVCFSTFATGTLLQAQEVQFLAAQPYLAVPPKVQGGGYQFRRDGYRARDASFTLPVVYRYVSTDWPFLRSHWC